MKMKEFFVDFGITFVLVLIVNALIVYGYNLLVHSKGKVEWQTTFFLAVVLAIVLPIVNQSRKKKENR